MSLKENQHWTFEPAIATAATFGITGLLREGEWRDPAPLEAARQLRHARYDLTLGLWDLTDNEVLRSTLLAETPLAAVPDAPVPIPVAAKERSEAKAERRRAELARLEEARRRCVSLRDAGWDNKTRVSAWDLANDPNLTADDRSEGDWHYVLLAEPTPLHVNRGLSLQLWIGARQSNVTATVGVWPIHATRKRLTDYFEDRRSEFEQLAGCTLEPFQPVSAEIWTGPGGYNDDVHWEDVASTLSRLTPAWRELLGDLKTALTADNWTLKRPGR